MPITEPPSQDARIFLDSYKRTHPEDVLEVHERLDPDQDLTALSTELASNGSYPLIMGPRNAGELPAQFVTNMFASRPRIARFLGCSEDELHARISEAFANAIAPCVLDDAPILENCISGDSIDLSTWRFRRHFEGDLGTYLTSGVFVGRNPETNRLNLSIHRCVPTDEAELATSLHSRRDLWQSLRVAERRGEPLPVAIVVGGHPYFMLAAAMRAAEDVDEMTLAGGLFGEAVETVLTPKYKLPVPAHAELVLEGYIDPQEHADEGPFGEFTGYGSERSTHNKVHVENVLHRTDPVIIDIVGGSNLDHLNLSRVPREATFVPAVMARYPSIERIYYPNSGVLFHCYVTVNSRMPGEARQAILALLGWDPFLKLVVAVDPDIDVTNDSEVLWAIGTRFQGGRDLFCVDNLPGMLLDPSGNADGTTARVGIDATMGPSFSGERIVISPEASSRARSLLANAATKEV